MIEVEIKVKVSIEDIVPKLEALGYAEAEVVKEKDVYFNSEAIDIRKAGKALRIRDHENLTTGAHYFQMNFKGQKIDTRTMAREEVEFQIPSYEIGEAFFAGLGFIEAGGVEKVRRYYRQNNVTCCVDTVAGLGEYMEIEVMAADEIEYAIATNQIEKLLSKLGLSMQDTTRRSYLSMLEKLNSAEK